MLDNNENVISNLEQFLQKAKKNNWTQLSLVTDLILKQLLKIKDNYSFSGNFFNDNVSLEVSINQLEGSMNEKTGVYEIGKTKDAVIDHRFCRPNR